MTTPVIPGTEGVNQNAGTSGQPGNAPGAADPNAGQPPAGQPPAGTPPAQDPPANPAPLNIGEDEPTKPATPAGDPVPVSYEPTGDAGLDLALDFIGQRGFGPDHPAVAAAIDGNFDLLTAEMKALGDKAKGFEKYIAAAKSAHARQKADGEAKATATRKAVMDVMGDEATWTAVQAWAKENADPAEIKHVNAALNAGGFVAKAVAHALKQGFERSGGTTPPPQATGKSPVNGAASNTAQGAGVMGPKEYASKVAELHRTGKAVDGHPEYEALKARARLGGAGY